MNRRHHADQGHHPHLLTRPFSLGDKEHVVVLHDGELDELVRLVSERLEDGRAEPVDADALGMAEGESEEPPAQVEVRAHGIAPHESLAGHGGEDLREARLAIA